MKETQSPGGIKAENGQEHNQSADQQRLPVRLLIAVVIQTQDERNTIKALERVDFTVIRLPSTGAFLGRRNVTLLIGLPENLLEQAMNIIGEQCRPRVEYISTPLEGAPMPIPIATPIPVGGATVFALPVDHFEEF